MHLVYNILFVFLLFLNVSIFIFGFDFLRWVVMILNLVFALIVFGMIKSLIHSDRSSVNAEVQKVKSANQELISNDQSRSEFITIASHQLKSFPTSVNWYISAIVDGSYGAISQEVKDALLKAKLANQSQLDIIDDMLNLSRIERGKFDYNFQRSDIVLLVKRLIDMYRSTAASKGLVIASNISEFKEVFFVMDAEKLSHAIGNLIDNAIKYSDMGVIRIDLRDETDDFCINITDQGIGVDSIMQKKIFDKFARGDNVNSQGLGLGLYVGSLIAKAHNGEISCISKGQGLGSKFVLRISKNLGQN